MYEEMKEGIIEENIKMVFDMMDSDRDGVIVPANIVLQFQRLGIPFNFYENK